MIFNNSNKSQIALTGFAALIILFITPIAYAATDDKDTINVSCTDLDNLNSCTVEPESASILEILRTINDVNQCEVAADNTTAVCPTSTGDTLVCQKNGNTASCSFRGQITVECDDISDTSASCQINKPKSETIFSEISPNTKSAIEREVSQVISDICLNDNLSSSLKRDCRALIDAAFSTNPADQNDLQRMLDQITPNMATIAFDTAKISGQNQVRTLNSFLSLRRLQKLRDNKSNFRFSRYPSNQFRRVGFSIYNLQNLGESTDPLLGDSFSKLGFFLNGTLGNSKKETRNNELGFTGDNIDVTSGFDYQFSNKINLGAAFGLSKSANTLNANRGELDYTSYTLLFFGILYPTPQTFVNLIFSYGGNEYDQNRNINFTQNNTLNNTSTTVNQIASANYFGNQLFTELAFGMSNSYAGINFETSLHLLYLKTNIDKFRETMSDPNSAGSGWAVSFNDNDSSSSRLKLGTQANYAWGRSWGVMLPQIGVYWNRELGENTEKISGSFVGDPNNTKFTLPSNESDANYFELKTGISAILPHGRMLFLSHQTFIAFDDYTASSFTAGFRLEI